MLARCRGLLLPALLPLSGWGVALHLLPHLSCPQNFVPLCPPSLSAVQVRAYFEANPIYLLAALVGLLCLPISALILRTAGKAAKVSSRGRGGVGLAQGGCGSGKAGGRRGARARCCG